MTLCNIPRNEKCLAACGGGSVRQSRATSIGLVATVTCIFLGVKLITIPLLTSALWWLVKNTVFPHLYSASASSPMESGVSRGCVSVTGISAGCALVTGVTGGSLSVNVVSAGCMVDRD